MAIEGSLADISLADVCQLLSLARKTGCLTVTDRSNFGYIYLEDGRVIHASILNRADRLGELLVRAGVVKPDDLAAAVEQQASQGPRRLGEILITLGALSEEELRKWITIQIEEAVYYLFTWTEGTFHFNPGERPDEEEVFLVSLSMDSLLIEGARRVDEWSQIEKKIPSLDLVFELASDPREKEGLHLSENQKKILPLLDGKRTVAELARDAGLVEFETGKALFELIQAGFARKVGRKGGEEEGDGRGVAQRVTLGEAFYRAGMLEDAAREFEGAIEADPEAWRARFRLGLIALRTGDPEAALAHFEAVAGGGPKTRYALLRNQALALEALGRFHEARELLKDAERETAEDAGLYLARGIVELKAGNARAARTFLERYQRALRADRPPPIFFTYAVLAAAADGSFDEAVRLGREGLRLYPTEAPILVNTGAVLDYRGDHEAAEQYFLRALNARDGAPPQAHKNLGDQAYRRGDLENAKSHYEQAVELDPALGDHTYVQLARIALDAADKPTAIEHLKRALEMNPRNEDARVRLEQLLKPEA